MFSYSEKDRYSRHFILEGFGEAAQLKLKQGKVLVIGAGGLGSPALLYLVAAGVGTITIVDGDQVSLSNLQRQVLYTVDDIGVNKAEAAKRRLMLLNPEINISSIPQFLDSSNILAILKDFDLVIDGSDNFSTRYLVNDACVISGTPLVYGAIFKFTGQVSVFNYKGGPTYRCLFPEPPAAGEMPGCGEIGVLGVLPGIIGTWQATEAIKILSGVGEVASGKLLSLDLLSNDLSSFQFGLNPDNQNINKLEAVEYTCETEIRQISWEEYLELKSASCVRLIDVREPEEFDRQNVGAENIPLKEFLKTEFSGEETLVVHCQSGKRARVAIESLTKSIPTYLLNITWD